MQSDLKSMTRKELEKLRGNVDKALARIEKSEMRAALAAAERAAKAHGYELSEITGAAVASTSTKKRATKSQKKPGKPKYANPNDVAQTWTGKGRQPGWFKAALNAGKSPDDLAIQAKDVHALPKT